jgi:lysophospholipase L1-like esterase
VARASLSGVIGKRPSFRAAPLVAAFVAAACGSGTPSGPTPTPSVPTYSLTVTVFYDENGSGQLDASEIVRVPGVQVVVGSVSATSADATGVAQVTGIVEGSATVAVRADSLPMYFQAGPAIPVQIPGTAEVRIPLTLAIGDNTPNFYYGYGDSITAGEGSTGSQGYGPRLQSLLEQHLREGQVRTFGRPGKDSTAGDERAQLWIGQARAAYALLLWGTNDWNDQVCQNQGPSACFTIDNLRDMIAICRYLDTLPVIATIIPGNPALVPAGRNDWIDQMNVRIKALAVEQNVALADLNAAFKARPNLAALFSDDIHPNDTGYQALAEGWCNGILRSRSSATTATPCTSTSASAPFRFGFRSAPGE